MVPQVETVTSFALADRKAGQPSKRFQIFEKSLLVGIRQAQSQIRDRNGCCLSSDRRNRLFHEIAGLGLI